MSLRNGEHSYDLIKELAIERLYFFFIFIAYFMVLNGTCHFLRFFLL